MNDICVKFSGYGITKIPVTETITRCRLFAEWVATLDHKRINDPVEQQRIEKFLLHEFNKICPVQRSFLKQLYFHNTIRCFNYHCFATSCLCRQSCTNHHYKQYRVNKIL